MSHNPAARFGRAFVVVSALVLGALCGNAGAQQARAANVPPAKNLSASVKTVFEDGTIVLVIGGRLVPARLDGVTLLPGAADVILASLPAGVRVRYQVIAKGPPATVVLWRGTQTLQDELLKKKLALKK